MNRVTKFIDCVAYLPSPIDRWVIHQLAYLLSFPRFKYSQYCLHGIKAIFPDKTDSERHALFQESQRNFLISMLNFSKRSPQYMVSILDKIEVQGYEKIRSLVDSNRSVIGVSIHMSDFFHGFLKLGQTLPQSRKIGIIKLLNNKKREEFTSKKFNFLNIDIKYFNVPEKPAIKALKLLKSGGIVVTFLDVKDKAIKTTEVQFFDRPAQMPCGPAELAITSNSVIVPLHTYQHENGHYLLKIEDPIDTASLPQTSFSERSTVVTQKLATHIQDWITTHPEQWDFWWLVNELWTKK